MAGLGTVASTLITTKGLFIKSAVPADFTALTFGAGVTPFISLYITSYTPPPVTPTSGGGGGGTFYVRPLQPGEIANQWQPINNPYLIPLDKEKEYFQRSKLVMIKMKLGDREVDRTYAIKENQAKILIKVVNIINVTRDRLKIFGSNIKRIASRAIIKVRNLRVISRTDK